MLKVAINGLQMQLIHAKFTVRYPKFPNSIPKHSKTERSRNAMGSALVRHCEQQPVDLLQVCAAAAFLPLLLCLPFFGRFRTGSNRPKVTCHDATITSGSRHLWRHSLLVLASQKLRMLLWRRELRLWSSDLRAPLKTCQRFQRKRDFPISKFWFYVSLRRDVFNPSSMSMCHEPWAEIPRPQADNIGTAVVMNSGWQLDKRCA